MKALNFWKEVALDRGDFLERVIETLRSGGVRFCAVGDVAVNAYAEPVVTLDFDLAVVADALARAESLLKCVAAGDSKLRVQLQTDPRYFPFVERAEPHELLGLMLPVASIEDVLREKIWAVQDPQRRPSKRQKDLADIARLIESRPGLRNSVPAEILSRLF
ncbi:MAG TPA: nucleotidyl transferase AbiEii/AbiGii toxin family protein [Thermoanaerobaculia bacterium]|nr:nucleotidyl transferase AbiEii/AbiGii toxin family protein [Thermoanaerobaculia bacterium]